MHKSDDARRSSVKETFHGLDWSNEVIHDRHFDGCVFENCRFSGATFAGCQFSDCLFKSCDLAAARFCDSVLLRVVYESSKLSGIVWAEVRQALFSVEFRECMLNYGSFYAMNLSKSVFLDCTAIDVDFREANLSNVSFAGTDLQDSTFSGTNLAHTDFSNARSYSIDPTQNTLHKTVFSWPEGMSLLDCFDIVWK